MYNKTLQAVVATTTAMTCIPALADHGPPPPTVAHAETSPAPGVPVNSLPQGFTLSATFSGVYQHGSFDNAGVNNQGAGAGKLDVEAGYTPTPNDEFHTLWRVASGNGMRNVWPGPMLPDAHDFEADVKNINGHDRSYVLQAWYKHDFHFDDEQSLGLTAGILDANVYLGQNEYADGEDVDFMNDAFVNPSTVGKPVYDLGGVAEFDTGPWRVTGLVMNSRTDDAAGHYYDYYALQARYRLDSALGEGNYRLWGFTTNDRFLDSSGTSLAHRRGIAASIAQPVSENFGLFAFLVHQAKDAAVDFQNQISGGVHIEGGLWGRADDAAGIGYAYLDGGNQGVDNSQLVESYVRFQLNQNVDISVDLQYLRDELNNAPTRTGWFPGLRFNATF